VRRPWFTLQPAEWTFFDTAPFRMWAAFDTAHPARYVWAELTSEEPLAWWTIAIEPRPAARIANPAARLVLGTLFSDTRKHYGLH
jgi:hypothetical protein